jgi:hypothetical protein
MKKKQHSIEHFLYRISKKFDCDVQTRENPDSFSKLEAKRRKMKE